MSKVLSLKLKDDIFQEIEEIVKKLKMPRNTYINEALSYFNLHNRRKLLQKQLEMESRRVQKNSMEVLEEFEQLEDWSSE
jgi:metal-responsive CopG/Arc/MetJ family transcriptional regulator